MYHMLLTKGVINFIIYLIKLVEVLPQAMEINMILQESNILFYISVPKSPSPNAYQIASEFQKDKSTKKGVGFGEGRQEMKITGPFVSTHKNKNPAPGSYDIAPTLSRTCYSMLGKNYQEDKEKKKTPGPGSCTPYK